MRALAFIVALLVGVTLTAAVAWNAAEAHYQNCVLTAQALPEEHTGYDALQGNVDTAHDARVWKRVQSCSRLP